MKYVSLNWSIAAPGVWEAVAGDGPPECSLTGAAGAEPRLEALNLLSDRDFPFGRTVKAYGSGTKTVLLFPLSEGETLYGGGLRFGSLVINAQVLRLRADHYGGRDDGRTHAPVPFYLSDRGYGVFIDTANLTELYMGSANRADSEKGYRSLDRNTDPAWNAQPAGEYVEAAVNDASAVKIVVFAGADLLETVRKFNLYCGGGFIPPKWGLGIWKRFPLLYSAAQVGESIAEFSERGFPLDVAGLEPGWQSRSYPCSYEWDKTRFPDPAGFIGSALEKGVRINLWENAYVSPESEIFSEMLPHSGSHLVWGGIVPDYTTEEAAGILREQHRRRHADIGVSGYKLDECDGFDFWLWPDHATFPSGTTGVQMRNLYGLLLQKITYGMFRSENRRTYGLTRATNAGANSFPYALYNDCYDFGEYLTALASGAFSGVQWVPEVRSAANGDEWLRRCQLVCFSPVAMINSWASDTEPWTFAEVSDRVREAFLLRKRLLPYLYSAYYRYACEGIPPFRPTVMEKGCGAGPDPADRFLAGDNLLAAPFAPGQNRREVTLPEGSWFDFYGGRGYEGGTVHTVAAADTGDCLPVFVRDGGIVPMLSDEPETLEIRYYGNKDGSFLLFDDDGETFDYEAGAFDLVLLSVSRNERGEAVMTAEPLHEGLGKKNYVNFRLSDRTKARPGCGKV